MKFTLGLSAILTIVAVILLQPGANMGATQGGFGLEAPLLGFVFIGLPWAIIVLSGYLKYRRRKGDRHDHAQPHMH